MSPLTSYNSEVGFSVSLGLLIGMGNTISKAPNMWSGTIPYLGLAQILRIVETQKYFFSRYFIPGSIGSIGIDCDEKIDTSNSTIRKYRTF